MNKNILVTGGAGYIGSHCVVGLKERGYRPVVVDNLSTGHREAVLCDDFLEFDLAQKERLLSALKEHDIDCVLHFASSALVGESMRDPLKYYKNNVSTGLVLLEAMMEAGVKKLIFSSTAAVYGVPTGTPIDENHPINPINPYGKSKHMFESIASDFADAFGLQYVFLRYFNAAGADPDGRLGEDHNPETHLIPNILDAILGKREKLDIFGVDYDTPDGSCVRDYIHISDLVEAHLLAIEYMGDGGKPSVFNLGSGEGYSVLEVIKAAERVTGKPVPARESARRPGDPPRLVASSKKAEETLGWQKKQDSLDAIIKTAWDWRVKNQNGYNS